MIRIIFGFLLECFIGKNIGIKEAIRYHKTRLFFVLIATLSIWGNFKTTDRLNTYYDAFGKVNSKYLEQKNKVIVMEANQQKLLNTVQELTEMVNNKCSSKIDKRK